jgi:hypothetical protein
MAGSEVFADGGITQVYIAGAAWDTSQIDEQYRPGRQPLFHCLAYFALGWYHVGRADTASSHLPDYASDGLAWSTTTFVPIGTRRWRSIMS